MYIICAIFGILFLFLDFKKTSIIKLTLAMTFLFCAIIVYKFPQNYTLQALSFPFFGILSNTMIRMILSKEEKEIQKNKKLKDYIGKTAIVTKDIGKTLSIDGLGMVEFENQRWSAKSVDDREIKAGVSVEIVSKENKILNVKVVK